MKLTGFQFGPEPFFFSIFRASGVWWKNIGPFIQYHWVLFVFDEPFIEIRVCSSNFLCASFEIGLLAYQTRLARELIGLDWIGEHYRQEKIFGRIVCWYYMNIQRKVLKKISKDTVPCPLVYSATVCDRQCGLPEWPIIFHLFMSIYIFYDIIIIFYDLFFMLSRFLFSRILFNIFLVFPLLNIRGFSD